MFAYNRYLLGAILTILAVIGGVLTDQLMVRISYRDQHALLTSRVQEGANALERQTMAGQAMGVASLLGLNEPLLKQVALGRLPPDDPSALERMRAATQVVHADSTYIISANGIAVAHDTRSSSFTGKNYTFRPYWQQAMAGRANVYAAVGTVSGERGLYIAAPLHVDDKQDSKIIGVVVIKMLASYLDDMLASMGSQALLVSPQSVVFAASNHAWLYRTTVPPTPEKIAAIAKLKQFGTIFEKSTPLQLPFPIDGEYADIGSVRHAIGRGSIDWQDQAGPWQVVVLQDTRTWVTPFQRWLVAGLAGVGVFMLFAFLLLRHETRVREHQQMKALDEAHHQLERHAVELEEKVAERTQDLLASQNKLKNLVTTGVDLGRERDRMGLLKKILFGGRDLLHCDAGTLYLITERKTLSFALRTLSDELPAVEIPLYDAQGAPNERYMATWCALHNQPVIVDDIYHETRFDVSGTRKMDDATGYRTISMLTVPLAPRDGQVIGVLQFLNALDPQSGKVVPFQPELIAFITAMATQAAVALDNFQLVEAQKELMESLIRLIAGAIDAKSSYTGGHCERVPELGIMLAEAAGRVTEGPLADFRFASEDEWREFRIGAWLHDCGKVTTPEYVVDKASKLETIYNRIHEVRLRFEVLLRDAMIERLEAIARGEDTAAANQAFESRKRVLLDDFSFIAKCNLGGEFMAPEDIERLKRIGAVTWQRHFDDRLGLSHEELRRYPNHADALPITEQLLADKPHHVIPRTDRRSADPKWGFKVNVPENQFNLGELYNLSVSRGTLTEEERFKINEHVMQSLIMLEQLPLPSYLKRVPAYAGTHHETLTGSGYPRKLTEAELSVPMRIMAIADIFEALTASDRPYKKAHTLSKAIDILASFKKNRHIDPHLFDLLLTSGVYMDYAEKYLLPEQIDEVDIKAYVG